VAHFDHAACLGGGADSTWDWILHEDSSIDNGCCVVCAVGSTLNEFLKYNSVVLASFVPADVEQRQKFRDLNMTVRPCSAIPTAPDPCTTTQSTHDAD
jgi:hypothetical protein